MWNQVIQSLRDGAEEGVRVVNDTVDDAIYIDPEEEADKKAEHAADAELQKEQNHVDQVNAKIDAKVETFQSKTDQLNQSFDQGIAKTKEKLQDVSRSNFMQAYRAFRMIYWGNMAKNYIADHPDWMNNIKEMGQTAASKLKDMGMTDSAMTETEQICARRNAMFGTPDAGISSEVMPSTEAILAGAEIPAVGLESLAMGM